MPSQLDEKKKLEVGDIVMYVPSPEREATGQVTASNYGLVGIITGFGQKADWAYITWLPAKGGMGAYLDNLRKIGHVAV